MDDQQTRTIRRWGSLETERSSWMPHWKDISTHLLPRHGRYFAQDRNRGNKRRNEIYDSTGTRAHRTLAAGMMAGMTSPARPWFRLGTSDPELAEYAPVKSYLTDVRDQMLGVFARSNTYRALHTKYEELGAFGTSATVFGDSYDNVIHLHSLTAGEYCIATNWNGEVDTLYREFDRTVAQVVQEFGLPNCSRHVQNLYNTGQYDKWVTIIHAIEPRQDRDPSKRDARNMPWRSCYFEKASNDGRFLRESGYRDLRAIAPRWATIGGDVYGYSPAMESLGDIKQLQHQQLRKGQGIDYKVKPPLQVPRQMKNEPLQTLPGGISYFDENTNARGIRSAWEVNLDLSELREDIVDVRERINSTFYADLFLMLHQAPLSNATATEIAERHEEKLLMLGPVLERVHNELHSPLIDLTFNRMAEVGILPPPPDELQGQDLKVEFVSMLAQAQRAIQTNSIDRFVVGLGQVASIKPEALDKFNADEWADRYSDLLGVDPELVVPGEQVAVIRQQRAQAEQAAAQREAMMQEAEAAKSLASAPTNQDNALTDVMRQFSGYV